MEKEPFDFERMGSVDEEHMQVNMEVQRRAKAAGEGGGSGTGTGAHAQSDRPDSGWVGPCRDHPRGRRCKACHA